MARGNGSNRGRGGFRGGSPRGAGFRGRGGRGGFRGGGRGRGRGGMPDYMDEFDLPIQMWPANQPPTPGSSSPHPRGRPFQSLSVGHTISQRGTETPRGRGRGRGGPGDASPYERGRGRGPGGRGAASKLRAGAPLSRILHEDRPLLRPIVFVRSVQTATLFQQQEEILKPVSETVADTEQAHVPTADQINRVFSGTHPGPLDVESSSDDEQLEEFDFADLGKIQAHVNSAAALSAEQKPRAITQVTSVEEKFTGFYVDTSPAPASHASVAVDRMQGILGADDDEDEEVIVYVAPHPRSGRITPAVPGSSSSPAIDISASSTSILTGLKIPETCYEPQAVLQPNTSRVDLTMPDSVPQIDPTIQTATQRQTAPRSPYENTLSPPPHVIPDPPTFDTVSFSFSGKAHQKRTRRVHTVGTPRSLLKRSRKPRRKSLRTLSALGAALSEAHLQREGRERDPRESEQRRGDSDINWGDSDEEKVDELSNSVGAMDIDEEISIDAMKSFVKTMGSGHMTMDDIADIEKLRAEDEYEADGGSSESGDDEVERVLAAEEALLVAETYPGDDTDEGSEDEEDDSDEEDTPRRGFQARLARIRNAQGKKKAVPQDSSDDDSDAMSVQMTWADEDEEYLEQIQGIINANAHILHGKDRKLKKELFRAVRDVDFDFDDELEGMMQPAARKKDKHIPPELKDQWDKDRAKKAANKRLRKQAMLEAAADPLASHKGGKKGRKAMVAAAKLEKSVEIPNRIVDLGTLERQIRRFLADIGGKKTMSLPPCDKETRKKIHELANAFNLKSDSKGNGAGRYTTLTRTSRSGINVSERKVRRILAEDGGNWSGPRRKGRSGPAMALNKHREGEEVGKAAPKIGESNIGFQMLASMGWTEGARIGLSGGLDAPLTAIMKKTKLGLGATLN